MIVVVAASVAELFVVLVDASTDRGGLPEIKRGAFDRSDLTGRN